ncbi:MAG: nitroreductase family protein [Desulfovibrio sp.]
MYQFTIDQERCVQCGLCAQDCLAGVIEMQEYPVLNKEGCMKCEHCLTVCPTGALSIFGKNPDDSTELKGNLPTPEQMSTLIKGRRSVRHYKDEDLDAATVKKLLEVAWNAPTGVNTQGVVPTVVAAKETMDALRVEVYEELIRFMEDGGAEKLADYGMLLNYMQAAVDGWKNDRSDLIFRGAPHLLIASSSKEMASPEADNLIFLSYFELLAQSMGVGTVWNGIAKFVLSVVLPHMLARLGIPEDHIVGYAMSFGRPAVKFQRTVERGPAPLNYVEL